MDFDDVLAEPGSTHGLDPVWQISFVLFSQTKLWLYRIFAALVAVPAALVWALVFSLITVVYVWILAPALRLFELGVAIMRRVRFIFQFNKVLVWNSRLLYAGIVNVIYLS